MIAAERGAPCTYSFTCSTLSLSGSIDTNTGTTFSFVAASGGDGRGNGKQPLSQESPSDALEHFFNALCVLHVRCGCIVAATAVMSRARSENPQWIRGSGVMRQSR